MNPNLAKFFGTSETDDETLGAALVSDIQRTEFRSPP